MFKIVTFLLLQCIFLPIMGFAHGDLDQRILQVTEEIKVSPDSSFLYFKRGKLLFQHEQYIESISDLKISSKLGYESVEQNLIFSKNYFRLEKYRNALSILNSILINDPFNVHVLRLRAQTYFKLSDFHLAAIDYEAVINYTTQSFPENYIETSIAWEALHTDESYESASNIIERGIKDLGELVSLFDRLIEIQTSQEHFLAAIETQKRVIALSHRKEQVYYRLSELYMLNENNDLALENLNLAKLHFEKLPLRIKNTSFMKALLENIKSKEILYQPNN